MKFYFLAIGILLITFTTNAQNTQKNYPADSAEPYRPFIQSIREKTVFKELPDYNKNPPPAFITKEQALEDIEMLQYIIDNAFSGRDYWQSTGLVSFKALYSQLKKMVEAAASNQVSTAAMEDTIYSRLSNINDAHTHIVGFKDRELVRNYRPYFSTVILEKKGDKLIVIFSGQPAVKTGWIYTGPKEFLFRTLSRVGTEQFLIGKQSHTNIDKLTAIFGTRAVRLLLHPSRIGNLSFDQLPDLFAMDTINGIPVVRSSSFSNSRDQQQLQQFMAAGKLLRDQPVFIWNLIDNRGGDGYYPSTFIKNFNSISQEEASHLILHSPVINQSYWNGKNSWLPWPEAVMKGLRDDNYPIDSVPEFKREKIRGIRAEKPFVKSNPVKYWEVTPKPKKEIGNYRGKAIVLCNHFTNSAGNNAIAYAKSIPNSLVIGENTGSAYTFANVKYYCLKYSLIKLWLPSELIIHPENRMEKGFLPDYWLDSDQPVEEVIKWLNNPATYQFVYNPKLR